MRHVECGAEHIADAVARAHRHAGGRRAHRKPGADLAIHPRVEIAGVGFHPRQAPAPASTVPLAPARRRKDALRASTGPRRNDRRRGCRSKETAIRGVCRVMAGSRITARGIVSRWRSASLTWVRCVGDAGAGAEIAAGDGGGDADLAHRRRGFIGGDRALDGPDPVDALDGAISLARQSCTALAPSVIEPPPTVTMRSAPAARACSVAAMTASRGVCGGIASKVPTQRGPSALRIFSISSVLRLSVPLTIRNARARADGPSARRPPRRPGGRTPPRPWRRKRHAPCARDCPPRTIWLCGFASNLAEEMRGGEHKNERSRIPERA